MQAPSELFVHDGPELLKLLGEKQDFSILFHREDIFPAYTNHIPAPRRVHESLPKPETSAETEKTPAYTITEEEPKATEPEMTIERKPFIKSLVELEISAGMERGTTKAIEEMESDWATEAASILEMLEGDYPEETPEYIPILRTDEIVKLLGIEKLLGIVKLKKLLSERGIKFMTTPHELALTIAEGGDEIFSRYRKYIKKSPREVMEELASYLPRDDEGQPLYFAEVIEEVEGRHPHDNPRHVKGHKRDPVPSKGRHRPQAATGAPMKETAYQRMLSKLRENGETVKAREVMEEIHSTSGLSVSYTDISALFDKYYGGFGFLGAKSELPREFLGRAAKLFSDLEEEGHGDNKLESWRVGMGIIEDGDILYRKHGEAWIYEGLLSASDIVKGRLDLMYRTHI